MTLDEFVAACALPEPPESLDAPLRALYWDARGDWKPAHAVAQEIATPTGSLIHAYLHRKEGDQGNAGYWYRRAERPPFRGTLEAEWRAIAAELCGP